MKKATEEFYCLPCDREAWKESIPLCCRFEFVIGNCTSLPEDHLTTNWRSMPFHLCAVPIIDSDRPCNLLEIAGRPPLRIRADEMIFVPSGVRHRITQIGDKHVPYSLWMHFRCDVLDGIDILDFFQMPNRLERSQAATPRRWLEELVAQPHLLDFSESLRQQLLGNAFLLELLGLVFVSCCVLCVRFSTTWRTAHGQCRMPNWPRWSISRCRDSWSCSAPLPGSHPSNSTKICASRNPAGYCCIPRRPPGRSPRNWDTTMPSTSANASRPVAAARHPSSDAPTA